LLIMAIVASFINQYRHNYVLSEELAPKKKKKLC
jgi:hypothetical protein